MPKPTFIPLILFIMSYSTLTAQKLTGVYRMREGQEMVAIFEFSDKGTFEFGYAYGAVDRSSSGHYTIRDGKVILQANKQPGQDFTIAHEERRDTAGTTVRISDPNSYLMQHVVCLFKKGDRQDQQTSDDDGLIHTSLEGCDTILVLHTLYPDVPTRIGQDKKSNYFELTLNPSLGEVSFKDLALTITREGLTCTLPQLFEREKAVFVKQAH